MGNQESTLKTCECYSSNKEVSRSVFITLPKEKKDCFQGGIQARHPQARVSECQGVCLRQMEAEKMKNTDVEKYGSACERLRGNSVCIRYIHSAHELPRSRRGFQSSKGP